FNWRTFQSDIDAIGVPAFVTKVNFAEDGALTTIASLSGMRSLTSITIPASVTSISNYAFSGCYALVEVYNLSELDIVAGETTFGGVAQFAKVVHTSTETETRIIEENGVKYYVNGSEKIALRTVRKNITTITLADDCTSIAGGAFGYCTSLANITIPENVTSIGSCAFQGCSALTAVNFSSSTNLQSIGSAAFYACTSLTNITIPSSVTSIGDGAFSYCSALTSITIPSNVAEIKSNTFKQCTVLSSVTLTDATNLTAIGDYAFYECDSLTGLDLSGATNLNSIGNYSFYSYDSLASLDLSDAINLTNIGSQAFYVCTSLISITIPESVISIGSEAFHRCTSLTVINYNAINLTTVLSSSNNIFCGAGSSTEGVTVNIGDKVKAIPSYLFYYSSATYGPNITNVNFAENSVCDTIGSYAFGNCASLTSIIIPDSVTNIGSNAFYGCSSLATITVKEGAETTFDCTLPYAYTLTNGETTTELTAGTALARAASGDNVYTKN
ncbi:MAG: leucine-rich repeat domain-containing protein, partial [Clostridia bacterium]|nr:leucine-rich repeat domain-containing protein [Clostridia bacterium]